MNTWDLVEDGLGLAGAGVVLIVLKWAAGERARVHRQWARSPSGRAIDWCIAMGSAVGCL